MRTTVNLDEDVLRVVRSLAQERGAPLGEVISTLIRDALNRPAVRYEADFPVFVVREGAPPITPEMVDAALNEP